MNTLGAYKALAQNSYAIVKFAIPKCAKIRVHLTLLIKSFSSLKSKYVSEIRQRQEFRKRHEIPKSVIDSGKFILLINQKEKIVIGKEGEEPRWLTYNDICKLSFHEKLLSSPIHVAAHDGHHKFILGLNYLSQKEEDEVKSLSCTSYVSFRQSLFTFPEIETEYIAKGFSLLRWNIQTKFCSFCGGYLLLSPMGLQKQCQSCNRVHYPALSPVGITLLSNEENSKALLVRQPSHPPGMYTCIAGFIEAGESVEENIKREIAEEVGLEALSVRYFGSQHWSLPKSSLMIGCFATVQETNPDIDRSELDDAKWFSPDEIKSALSVVLKEQGKVLSKSRTGGIWVPPPGAIAHKLIKHWLQEFHSFV